jgi:2-polyprenyl-3-methyl-5-hydroxy-6-metoxy-1,4-benzoquinol methylase
MQAGERHRLRFEPLRIDGLAVEVPQIANLLDELNAFAEARDTAVSAGPPDQALPLWAHIWPTALLLSHLVRRLADRPGPRPSVLDIGAGVGVCGLFAARFGLQATITDIHPEALLFARIGVLRNGLGDLAEVRRVDFTADRLDRRYDCILGSEILYDEGAFRPLAKFLLAHLARGGEALLAKSYTRKADRFLRVAEKEFHIEERVLGCAGGADSDAGVERHLSTIYRLRAKRDV